MTKFLVSTKLGIVHTARTSVFGIDKDSIIECLQADKDVYVFDTLQDAKGFLKLVSSPPSTWIVMQFMAPTADYPIFEVEAEVYNVHDKLSEFESVENIDTTDTMPVRVFTQSGQEIKKLSSHLKLSVSKGLTLNADQIINVYSANGYKYDFEHAEEATCTIS